MKSLIKSKLPNWLIEPLRHVRQSTQLYIDSIRQARRFKRSYSTTYASERVRLESRIIFLTHQIEKGLSHKNFRYGFGKKIFNELPSLLSRLEIADPNFETNPVYKDCVSALHEYVLRHEEADEDISWQKGKFTKQQWKDILNATPELGGSLLIRKSTKLANRELGFSALAEGRHSIREFSNEPLTLDEIMDAVKIAMRTPSVCNRQPTRLHIILDKDKISQALKLQSGVNGYPAPPVLILVTSDLRSFMSSYERNEGYTDGGLFAMSLLYAFESVGIAACPLNTMFSNKIDSETRKLLNIPDNEVLVMYIEAGKFLEESKTCKSTRLDPERIVTVLQ